MWGFRPRGRGLSAPDTARYFAVRNGITSAPETEADPAHSDANVAIEHAYYRESGHQPVTLHTMRGGGHVIPGPRAAPFIMGRTPRRFAAAAAVGEFFGLDDARSSG